jgi:hypothetical protein
MSNTVSEFLDVWNETFPVAIRDADMKNPTEQMLRKCFIAILKQLYVNTSSFEHMDGENGARLKASRVKLIAHVNHFYKIANPAAKLGQWLCYMDLIHPGEF